ncbi:putative methyltransferase (fragment) [Sulfurovum sp. enrichment culture clone C5]|uniref:Putative methyltransferase n=1 Tax=Sulfurovum sp. enrichment culture clone C5 TaxID=497650 RepID=A0A0S4XPN6_9BACT
MSKNRSRNIIKEFSRFSNEYDSHSIIQTKIAKKIISDLPKKILKILWILDVEPEQFTSF